MPILNPHEEALLRIVHRPVDRPVEAHEPLQFHAIELLNWNAADFSPGSILEGIIVEKFASQKETSREHAIDSA